MSNSISRYFEEVESHLIERAAIVSYKVIQREVSIYDGKIRIRARLIDDGKLECFLYVLLEREKLRFAKYSYHWQDSHQNLTKRWDNAPHFPNLANAPHHTHFVDETVSASETIPDVFVVLDEIEKTLISET